jgi:phosphoserine phosphatase
MKSHYLFLVMALLITACAQEVEQAKDPLPSWNEGATRDAIVGFVRSTTDENSPDFIPGDERLVVFDNDGTLWSERPLYFQFEFAIDMVRAHAAGHPEWKEEQPFKGILENDVNAIMASGEEGLLRLLAATHTGTSNKVFMEAVDQWIDTARHNHTGKLYREMVFQPMLEVLDYFRSNGFTTYIVSGGTVHFMRPWTEEVYGIPPEQVIGSRFRMQFVMTDEGPAFMRGPGLDFMNDKEGKPVNISQIIGKRPVAAFGNSDGDLAMLQYTAAGEGRRLMVYIHHTDAEREYAYDRESHIGKLDKGLDEAVNKGWVVVDMKNDWKTIYP